MGIASGSNDVTGSRRLYGFPFILRGMNGTQMIILIY